MQFIKHVESKAPRHIVDMQVADNTETMHVTGILHAPFLRTEASSPVIG